MAAWVDKGTCRAPNVHVISFSLAELAGLDKVGGVVNWMKGPMVEKVDIKKELDSEEDWRPVL